MKAGRVTADRLKYVDSFRPQIHLEDKMVWAVGYNAISDYDPSLARKLRDTFAQTIQDNVLESLRLLVKDSDEFKKFYKVWLDSHVDSNVRPIVDKWIKRNL